MNMIHSLVALVCSSAILYMLGGVVLGLIFGAIPGLSATLAVVILIPLTYTLETNAAMALLIGAYVGGMSGGFVSAIMLNMPGTPSDVATCFDGFPLAQRGLAGKAMGVGVVSNLFGSLFGWICLLVFGSLLSKVALGFGAIETTAAILFGFTAVISLGGSDVFRSLISALMGLSICCIGYDVVTSMQRATYGIKLLKNGFGYMPALIGLFVLAEIFSQVEQISNKYVVPKQAIKDIWPSRKELLVELPNAIRSSAIGVAIGLLPGIGGSFANFVTYDQAKKHAKNPEEYGKGALGGIVATQASTKGTIGGALVPFIALGIPGDIVTAALLGGLMIKGITPGPLFSTEHPDTVFTIYNAVLVASILVFLVMAFVGIRYFPQCLRLPKYILLPIVMIFALIGTYNMNFTVNDVWCALLFGVLGFVMDKVGMPKTPMVITMILGSSFETRLRSALSLTNGSFLPFITHPFSAIFIIATVVTIGLPIIKALRNKKAAQSKNCEGDMQHAV